MPCDGSRVLFVGGFHHSGTGALLHALKVRALGVDDRDIICRRCAFGAGVFNDVKASVWTHGRVTLLQLHDAPSVTKEPTPLQVPTLGVTISTMV